MRLGLYGGIINERMESRKEWIWQRVLWIAFRWFYGDDEDIIAKFIEDETNDRFVYTNAFIYTSKELNADHDILFANSIEDAKQQIEEMLIEHWKDGIEYLEDRLKEFQEK